MNLKLGGRIDKCLEAGCKYARIPNLHNKMMKNKLHSAVGGGVSCHFSTKGDL